MKNFTIIFMFLFPFIGFAQEIPEDLKIKFKNIFCECAEQFKNAYYNEQVHETCIFEKLDNSKHDFLPFSEKNPNQTDLEKLSKLGKNLTLNYLEELVYECEPYIATIESIKVNMLDYFKQENGEDDLSLINLLIEQMPDDYEFYTTRGIIYYSIDDYENAVLDLNHSLKINPEYENALLILGWIHEEHGNFDEAIEQYQKLVDQFNSFEYHAFIYAAQRNQQESLQN